MTGVKIYELTDAQDLYDLIAQVTSEDFDEALQLTEIEIEKLKNGEIQASNFETWETSLKSVWFFYKALKVWISEGNTQYAYESFGKARMGFEYVGHDELNELTAGLEVYVEGILEVMNANINHGLKKIERVKEYFTRSGEFGSKYEKMLDHMKSDTFAVSAASSIQMKDFNSAQVLLEEASKYAEEVAEKYYDPDDPNYSFFKGLSKYYLGMFKCFWTSNELSNFAFDTVVFEGNLDAEINEACELLKNCDQSNKLQVNVFNIALGLKELSAAMKEMSIILQNLTKNEFQYPREKLESLQKNVQSSKTFFSKAGTNAKALLTFSDEISAKIENIKRSIKPKIADFGKHSGVIACIIFIPTSFILMWVNKIFGFEIESWGLLVFSFMVSLVGGFGYGAVKFKDLIFAFIKHDNE